MTGPGVPRADGWGGAGCGFGFVDRCCRRMGGGARSNAPEKFGEEGVGEDATAVKLFDEAALEEFFLGGVDGGGHAEGVADAVGVVEAGGGFAGEGDKESFLRGGKGEHLLFVLIPVETGKTGECRIDVRRSGHGAAGVVDQAEGFKAELLDVIGNVVDPLDEAPGGIGFDGKSGGSEPAADEGDAFIEGRFAEGNGQGRFVERARMVGEHPAQEVVAAAQKDVGDVAVGLDDGAHDALETVVGEKAFHLLELVEDNHGTAIAREKTLGKVEDFGERIGADGPSGGLERKAGGTVRSEVEFRAEVSEKAAQFPESRADGGKAAVNLGGVCGKEKVDGGDLDDIDRDARETGLFEGIHQHGNQ